jgi:hypothetical protein
MSELFDHALFAKNLAALAKRNPPLAAALREAPSDEGVSVVPAKNGELTLTIDGRCALSQYAPGRDAERIAAQEPAGGSRQRVMIVLGFELGYLPQALRQRAAGKIHIVEPRLGALRAALGAIDRTDLLADPRVFLNDAVDKLYFTPDFGVRLTPDLAIHMLPGCRQIYGQWLGSLQDRVGLVLDDRTIANITGIERQRLWFANAVANFRHWSQAASIGELRGAFAGTPAVAVSAGPSLDRNVDLLREWKGRGVIISVGTAIKRCVAAGATPDFVLALESNDILPQFAGVPEIRDCYAGLFIKCHPRLWELPAKGLFFFGEHATDTSWIFKALGISNAIFNFSGSVSTAAFSLAVLMGCNPVVIIGQDLAFADSGQSHFAGVSSVSDFSVNAETIADMKARGEGTNAMPLVEGWHGGMVVTRANLRNYLMWFEQMIPLAQAEGVRVINATEGGARIRAAEQMTFAEATQLALAGPLDVAAAVEPRRRPPRIDLPPAVRLLDSSRKDMLTLIRLTQEGQRLAAEVNALIDRGAGAAKKLDSLLAKLDQQDRKIAPLVHANDNLLTAVAGRELLLVRTAFDYEGLSRRDALRLNMKHSTTMYQGVYTAAKLIADKLGDLLAVLSPDQV